VNAGEEQPARKRGYTMLDANADAPNISE